MGQLASETYDLILAIQGRLDMSGTETAKKVNKEIKEANKKIDNIEVNANTKNAEENIKKLKDNIEAPEVNAVVNTDNVTKKVIEIKELLADKLSDVQNISNHVDLLSIFDGSSKNEEEYIEGLDKIIEKLNKIASFPNAIRKVSGNFTEKNINTLAKNIEDAEKKKAKYEQARDEARKNITTKDADLSRANIKKEYRKIVENRGSDLDIQEYGEKIGIPKDRIEDHKEEIAEFEKLLSVYKSFDEQQKKLVDSTNSKDLHKRVSLIRDMFYISETMKNNNIIKSMESLSSNGRTGLGMPSKFGENINVRDAADIYAETKEEVAKAKKAWMEAEELYKKQANRYVSTSENRNNTASSKDKVSDEAENAAKGLQEATDKLNTLQANTGSMIDDLKKVEKLISEVGDDIKLLPDLREYLGKEFGDSPFKEYLVGADKCIEKMEELGAAIKKTEKEKDKKEFERYSAVYQTFENLELFPQMPDKFYNISDEYNAGIEDKNIDSMVDEIYKVAEKIQKKYKTDNIGKLLDLAFSPYDPNAKSSYGNIGIISGNSVNGVFNNNNNSSSTASTEAIKEQTEAQEKSTKATEEQTEATKEQAEAQEKSAEATKEQAEAQERLNEAEEESGAKDGDSVSGVSKEVIDKITTGLNDITESLTTISGSVSDISGKMIGVEENNVISSMLEDVNKLVEALGELSGKIDDVSQKMVSGTGEMSTLQETEKGMQQIDLSGIIEDLGKISEKLNEIFDTNNIGNAVKSLSDMQDKINATFDIDNVDNWSNKLLSQLDKIHEKFDAIINGNPLLNESSNGKTILNEETIKEANENVAKSSPKKSDNETKNKQLPSLDKNINTPVEFKGKRDATDSLRYYYNLLHEQSTESGKMLDDTVVAYNHVYSACQQLGVAQSSLQRYFNTEAIKSYDKSLERLQENYNITKTEIEQTSQEVKDLNSQLSSATAPKNVEKQIKSQEIENQSKLNEERNKAATVPFTSSDDIIIYQAKNIEELREEYNILRIYNKQLAEYSPKAQIVEDIKKWKEELLQLNPQLREVADSTKIIMKADFSKMFGDSFANKTVTSSTENVENLRRENALLEENTAKQKVNTESRQENQTQQKIGGNNPIARAMEEEGQTVDEVVSKEQLALQRLQETLHETALAVDTKTNAFREEGQTVDGVVNHETQLLTELIGHLYMVQEAVKELSGTPVKLDLDFDPDSIDCVKNLKDAINNITSDNINSVVEQLKKLGKDALAKSIQSVANSINDLKRNLNNLTLNSDSFIKDLAEIAKQSGNIKELVDALKKNKNAIKEIQGAVLEDGEVAIGATTANNPKDANKRRGATAVDSNGWTEDEYKDREEKIKEETEVIKNMIKAEGGTITDVSEFRDSLKRLIKTQVKAEKEIDDAVQRTTYTTGYKREKKDEDERKSKPSEAYYSTISTDDYEKYEKKTQKEILETYKEMQTCLSKIKTLKNKQARQGKLEAEQTNKEVKRLYEKVRYRQNLLSASEKEIKAENDKIDALRKEIELTKTHNKLRKRDNANADDERQKTNALKRLIVNEKRIQQLNAIGNSTETYDNGERILSLTVKQRLELDELIEARKEDLEIIKSSKEYMDEFNISQQKATTLAVRWKGYTISEAKRKQLGSNPSTYVNNTEAAEEAEKIAMSLKQADEMLDRFNTIASDEKAYKAFTKAQSSIEEVNKKLTSGAISLVRYSSAMAGIENKFNEDVTLNRYAIVQDSLKEIITLERELRQLDGADAEEVQEQIRNKEEIIRENEEIIRQNGDMIALEEEKLKKIKKQREQEEFRGQRTINRRTTAKAQKETVGEITELSSSISRSIGGALKGKAGEITINALGLNDNIGTIDQVIEKLNRSALSPENMDKAKNSVLRIGETLSKFDINNYFNPSDYVEDFRNNISKASNELTQAADKYLEAMKSKDVDKQKQAFKDMANSALKIGDLYNSRGDNKIGKELSITKLIDKATKTMKENSAMTSELKSKYNSLIIEMRNVGEASANQVTNFTDRLVKLNTELEESGRTGRNFFDGITLRAKSMTQSWIAMYFSLYDIFRYVRQAFSTVKDYDSALTEMRKVSDETITTLRDYQNTTFDTADAIATTALELQNSTAEWMRLGESISDAQESAKDATILMNVSEFESIDDATDSLVAMSQAYQDLDKMEIIDKLNNIGNNYSISTDQLAVSLQKSAATLSIVGTDIDKAIALTTAGNSILRDPESVGAGLKTVALRIQGTDLAKKELEEMGEDAENVVHTTSKIQNNIKKLTAVQSNGYKGFDILDDNGNYKDVYEILLGISKVFKEIQETDKKIGENRSSALLETLAGKNRASVVGSIIADPELLENVYNSSKNSDGSAQQELEKQIDSIEGRIAQFQNQLQKIIYQFENGNFLKQTIKDATSFLSVLNKIVGTLNSIGKGLKKIPLLSTISDKFSSIATIGTGIGFYKTLKNRKNIDENGNGYMYQDLLKLINGKKSGQQSIEFVAEVDDSQIDALRSKIEAIENKKEHIESFVKENNLGEGKNVSKYIEEVKDPDNSKTFGLNGLNNAIRQDNAVVAEKYTKNVFGVTSAIKDYNNLVKEKTSIDIKNTSAIEKWNKKQSTFISNISAGNKTLGSYLSNLSGKNGSIAGFIGNSVKNTAMGIGKSAIDTVIGSIGGTIGMTAVSFGVSMIDKIVNAESRAEEKTKKTTQAINELNDSLKQTRSDIENDNKSANELIQKYSELAGGVNEITKSNETLSSEQYEEFLDVSNQLADLFPNLTRRYDENGNAILGIKGNVDEAVKSLREYQEEHEKASRLKLKEQVNEYFDGDKENGTDGISSEMNRLIGQSNAKNQEVEDFNTINTLLNGKGKVEYNKLNQDLWGKIFEDDEDITSKFANLSPGATGRIDGSELNLTAEQLEKARDLFKVHYDEVIKNAESANNEIETLNKEISDKAFVYLEDSSLYENASDNVQNYMKSALENIDWSTFDDLSSEGIQNYIRKNVLTPMNAVLSDKSKTKEVNKALSALFTLDDDEMSIEEKTAFINKYISILAKYLNKPENQLKIQLGFETPDNLGKDVLGGNGYNQETQQKMNTVRSHLLDRDKGKVGQLTENQLNIASGLNLDPNVTISWDTLLKKIKKKTGDAKTELLSFSDAWKKFENDKALEGKADELKELAKAGELTPETLSSVEAYNGLIKDTGMTAEDTAKKIYAMLNPEERLSAATSKINSLSSAYSEMKENKYNKQSTLDGLGDGFKSLDGYKKFRSIVEDSTRSTSEMQKAYNNLATEYIKSTGVLDMLNEKNKNLIITQLKDVGVVNAEELVIRSLRKSKMDEAEARRLCAKYGIDESNVTAQNIQQLINEGRLTDAAAKKIAVYALKKRLSNNVALSETASIKSLLVLAGATEKAVEVFEEYIRVKKKIQDAHNGKSWNGAPIAAEKAHLKALRKQLQDMVTTPTPSVNMGITNIGETQDKLKKAADKSKKAAKKNSTTYKKFSQTIDWCAQTITNLTNKIGVLQAKLDNTTSLEKQIEKTKELVTAQSGLASASGMAANKYENNYNGKLAKLGKKYGQKYVDKVVNGEFTIENFKGKTKTVTKNGKSKTIKSDVEKLWNLLQKVIEARDKFYSQEEDFQKQLKQLQEYSNELASLRWDNAADNVDKLTKKIDILNKKMSNTGELASKNALVDSSVKEQKSSYDEYKAAYDNDKAEENNLYNKLNKKNRGKIDKKTGLIDLKSVTGKSEKAIKKQREIAAKYNAMVKQNQTDLLELQSLQQDYITAYNEAFETKSSNITNNYSNRLSMLEYSANTLNDYIDLAEAKGQYVDNSFYDALVENSKKKQEEYAKEIQHLENLQDATTRYSQEWYDLEAKVQEALASQRAETKNQVDYMNKQADNIVNLHNAVNQYMQDVIDEARFVRGLLDDVDLYDKDTGEMTNIGWTAVALGITEYEALQKQIEQTEKSLQELDEKYADDKSNVKYIEDRRTLIKTYQDEVTASKEAKKGVSDLITNGYEKQLSALQKLINKKKEQLEVEKSEHDYQKTIAEKSKNISDLDKQRKMLNGDNSEDAMAKKQSLDKQLQDAREDLQETQYEKYIERQESYLDDLQENFSEIIEGLKQDIDGNFNTANQTLTDIKTAEEEYRKNSTSDTTLNNIKKGLVDENGNSKITKGVDAINEQYGTEQSNTRTDIGNIFKSGTDNILGNIVKGTKDGDKTSVGFAEAIDESLNGIVTNGIKAVSSDPATVTSNPNAGYGGDKNGEGGLNDASNGGGNPGGETVTNVVPEAPSTVQVDKQAEKSSKLLMFASNKFWQQATKGAYYDSYDGKSYKKWSNGRKKVQDYLWGNNFMSRKNSLTQAGLAYLARYAFDIGSGADTLNPTQMLQLDDEMRSISGYSTGGFLNGITSGGTGGAVAKVIKRNNDDGIATFKKGEAILSPAQTAMFREMLANMDTITTFQSMLKDNNKSYATNNTTTSATSIDNVNFEFNLPNVVDPQTLIKTVQTNTSVQKTLQEATIGQLNTTNRLGINRIR